MAIDEWAVMSFGDRGWRAAGFAACRQRNGFVALRGHKKAIGIAYRADALSRRMSYAGKAPGLPIAPKIA